MPPVRIKSTQDHSRQPLTRNILNAPVKTKATGTARLTFVEPMYARLVQDLPQGKEWLYEIKFDGYRCLAGRDAQGVTLWSRRGNLLTAQFPKIAAACERLAPGTFIDGEIVALDENGRISFNLLQHHRSKAQALLFFAFDVLIDRGRYLLKTPLQSRRDTLKEIVHDFRSPVALSETIDAEPAELVQVVKEFGFEGVVAKRKDSCYESGERSGAWVKYKVNKSREFVIGGYTVGNPFDALVVGCYQGAELHYVAKVRNGFVPRVRKQVSEKFKGLETATCPFGNLPEKKRTQWALTLEGMKECRWLTPVLIAQIEFTEWTPDDHLRHTRFVGLREDKNPHEVSRESS